MFTPNPPVRGRKFPPFFRFSVRAACEHVLAGRVRPLSVAQITAKVLALGWEPQCFTPPTGIVNVVLNRSHRSPKSTIVRTGPGLFRSVG